MHRSAVVALFLALVAQTRARPLGYGNVGNDDSVALYASEDAPDSVDMTAVPFPGTTSWPSYSMATGDSIKTVIPLSVAIVVSHANSAVPQSSPSMYWPSWRRREPIDLPSADAAQSNAPSNFARVEAHPKNRLFGLHALSSLHYAGMNGGKTKRDLTASVAPGEHPTDTKIVPAESPAPAQQVQQDTCMQTSEPLNEEASGDGGDGNDDDDDSSDDAGERARLAKEDATRNAKAKSRTACLESEKSGQLQSGTCETQEVTATLAGVLRRRDNDPKSPEQTDRITLVREAMEAVARVTNATAAAPTPPPSETSAASSDAKDDGKPSTSKEDGAKQTEATILTDIREIEALKAARAKLEEAIVKVQDEINKSVVGNAYLTATVPL